MQVKSNYIDNLIVSKNWFKCKIFCKNTLKLISQNIDFMIYLKYDRSSKENKKLF